MKIRKGMALLIAALLLFSIVPLVAADEGSDGQAPSDNERYRITEVGDNSGDMEEGMNTYSNEASGMASGERARNRVQREAREMGREMRKEGHEGMQNIREEFKGAGVRKNIREHQKEMFMNAIEKCREMGFGEKCEEKFKKRMALVEKLAEKDLERLKKLEVRKQERYEKFVELKNKFKNVRNLTDEQRTALKETFETAKVKFNEAKEARKVAHDTFSEARKTVKDTCKDTASDACKQAQELALTKAKEVLTKSADAVVEHLTKVKARIQATQGLSAQEVADYVAKIDAKITAMQEIKSRIVSVATKEDVKKLAQEIKDQWKDVQVHVNTGMNKVAVHKMAGVLVQVKHLDARLNNVLARLTEKGKDVTSADALVTQFHAKTDLAQQKFAEAEAKFKEFMTTKNTETNALGHAALKEAQTALQDAREILRNILSSVKELGGQEELKEEVQEKEDSEEEMEHDAATSVSETSSDETTEGATA